MLLKLILLDTTNSKYLGSGALSGKMKFVMIVENNKIDNYLGQIR